VARQYNTESIMIGGSRGRGCRVASTTADQEGKQDDQCHSGDSRLGATMPTGADQCGHPSCAEGPGRRRAMSCPSTARMEPGPFVHAHGVYSSLWISLKTLFCSSRSLSWQK